MTSECALIWGVVCTKQINMFYTLPETTGAPATLGLEDEFPFGKAYFQGLD